MNRLNAWVAIFSRMSKEQYLDQDPPAVLLISGKSRSFTVSSEDPGQTLFRVGPSITEHPAIEDPEKYWGTEGGGRAIPARVEGWVDTQLAVSRDTVSWTRWRQPFLGRGEVQVVDGCILNESDVARRVHAGGNGPHHVLPVAHVDVLVHDDDPLGVHELARFSSWTSRQFILHHSSAEVGANKIIQEIFGVKIVRLPPNI